MTKKSKIKRTALAKSPKKVVTKVDQAKKVFSQKVGQINRVIGRLENEVEGLLKKIVKQGERSRKELRKNFDDLISRLGRKDFISIATETRDDLEKEVRKIAEDIVGLVKEIEKVPGRLQLSEVFGDIRENFSSLLGQFGDLNFVQRALGSVEQTRKEVLGLLSIPTQDEVFKLEKKIVSLEKRLSNLTRKAA